MSERNFFQFLLSLVHRHFHISENVDRLSEREVLAKQLPAVLIGFPDVRGVKLLLGIFINVLSEIDVGQAVELGDWNHDFVSDFQFASRLDVGIFILTIVVFDIELRKLAFRFALDDEAGVVVLERKRELLLCKIAFGREHLLIAPIRIQRQPHSELSSLEGFLVEKRNEDVELLPLVLIKRSIGILRAVRDERGKFVFCCVAPLQLAAIWHDHVKMLEREKVLFEL